MKNGAEKGTRAMTVEQLRRWAASWTEPALDSGGAAETSAEEMILRLRRDGRAAAASLASKIERAVARRREQLSRWESLLEYERELWRKGITLVAGIDEAGRGPLAGPVVAAAVVLRPGTVLLGVDDSKRLSPETRENLYPRILEKAVTYGIGAVDAARIDAINILEATKEAMAGAVREAADKAGLWPEHLLVDAVALPELAVPQTPIIRGDSVSASIAAASIIAKVCRDRLMIDYDLRYPGYGFDRHKGYGSPDHLEALRSLGPSPIHRRSFSWG